MIKIYDKDLDKGFQKLDLQNNNPDAMSHH